MEHLYEYLIGGKKLGKNKYEIPFNVLQKGDDIFIYTSFNKTIYERKFEHTSVVKNGNRKLQVIYFTPGIIVPGTLRNNCYIEEDYKNKMEQDICPLNSHPSSWWLSTSLEKMKEKFPYIKVEK